MAVDTLEKLWFGGTVSEGVLPLINYIQVFHTGPISIFYPVHCKGSFIDTLSQVTHLIGCSHCSVNNLVPRAQLIFKSTFVELGSAGRATHVLIGLSLSRLMGLLLSTDSRYKYPE